MFDDRCYIFISDIDYHPHYHHHHIHRMATGTSSVLRWPRGRSCNSLQRALPSSAGDALRCLHFAIWICRFNTFQICKIYILNLGFCNLSLHILQMSKFNILDLDFRLWISDLIISRFEFLNFWIWICWFDTCIWFVNSIYQISNLHIWHFWYICKSNYLDSDLGPWITDTLKIWYS